MSEFLLIVFASFTVFLAENWGNILSGIGTALTVGFSWRAKNAATLAKEASQNTKTKLQGLDLLSEISRLNGRIDDMNYRLEAKDWPIISERATDLRVSIAAIIANDEAVFSKPLQERLGESVSQFRIIAGAADRFVQKADANPDIVRYKRIVADQKETIVLALQEARIKMEVQS
ncbi:hypothetical protein C1J03_19800 [Sulfitobacter sp. SK012]|uniref:hypothetical protein n=1 Tax=Sulfitobacter sp. SK012 TaxID=1389005 RepID=UPI000E0B9EE9|nr:hypothetical protein [Sulfitobacter sp. SK012]AXI48047.1 hypothetical protein C1J03_19800 [Sulfitobacter sp. SK012]